MSILITPAASGGGAVDSVGFWDGPSFYTRPTQGGNTSTTSSGMGISAGGTATARNVDGTNLLTRQIRIGYIGAAAANTTVGWVYQGSPAVVFNSERVVFECQWFVSDSIASGAKGMCGFSTGTGLGSGQEPDGDFFGSRFFVGYRSTDTNLVVISKNGSGAATVTTINGGTGFPCNTNAADLYLVRLEYNPDGPSLIWTVTNKTTSLMATGVITTSTDIPSSTDVFGPVCRRSSGANVAAPSIDICGWATGKFVV